MCRQALAAVLILAVQAGVVMAFPVDTSDQPAGHPPPAPRDGEATALNPPAMVWRVDATAASYIVEMAPDPEFVAPLIRVEGIDMPFYNHSEVLAEGVWHWRYYVVREDGAVSEASPSSSFVITDEAVPLPVPPTEEILRNLPDHPRVYVTPDTLEGFRARRHGIAAEAWEHVRYAADQSLRAEPQDVTLKPFPENPGTDRRQVFYLEGGEAYVPEGVRWADMNAAASRANTLSWAYLISGEEQYAQAARKWLAWLAPFRIDYHLDRRARAEHDTVVYCYEYGLRNLALTYDRIWAYLDEEERAATLAHVEYHGDNAYRWCRDRLQLHLRYENSHGQQCMHALLTTTMAVMGDLPAANEWADWLIRQYANRLAWGADDGGYTEGQTYGHKFSMILDGLAAMKTATGVDVFARPRIRNSGDFWLYCMALNYWHNHWGDVYHLLMPMQGSGSDGFIANLLASMTEDRAVKWYSETVVTNPAHIPFWYLSETGLEPKPPVDIPQGRLFPDVGQLAAYDRFYDHRGNRIFFRASPWGSHSHSHCDQNGFALHTGGEIMACDAGYYTYYGDTYHREFSMASVAHNTLLVNGKGQPKSITSRGRVTGFFDSPHYCIFTGSAAEAYPQMLERFDRTILFIRPGVWIVHDDVRAPEEAEYTWLLNTFEAAEIDEPAAIMTIRQRDRRLQVRHLAPEGLTWAQSNERPHPMLTRAWCRYTEAFPQTFNIQVTTPPAQEERILAFMQAYDEAAGPRVEAVERITAGGAEGVRFSEGDLRETAVFRPAQPEGEAEIAGLRLEGRAASVGVDAQGRVRRWLLYGGTTLAVEGRPLLLTGAPVDAAADYASPAAAAQVWVRHDRPLRLLVHLPQRPAAIHLAPAHQPQAAREADFEWRNDMAEVLLEGAGETVLWVDPSRDLTIPPEPLGISVWDSDGEHALELETAVADSGEIIAFAQLMPREPGLYTLTAPGAELLVQDRWDLDLSARGHDEVTGSLRDATEVFIRYRPEDIPTVAARLQQSDRGRIVNMLRNGGFEAGIPDYPPRGWSISHPRRMGYTWPHWTQEDAVEGVSALKFVRPEIRMTLTAQPMRLRTGGAYVLRFMARGSATQASVSVSGQLGTRTSVAVAPSDEWREYRTELEVSPGYTTVAINFGDGGEPDQVLWVDDMQFGYVAQ